MANEESARRVAIVTALSLECLAVCEHLEDRVQITHPFGTVYERGSFPSDKRTAWDVTVVESGAGNVSTAFEVERVITFVRPELVLFVGVAGGLKDVRLGDVVIGTKVYAYESGKEKETLETRPVSQPASYRLAQRAKAEIRNGLWVRRIKGKLLDGIPRAFAGPIAAGEKVVASTSSATHQFLKEHYGDSLAVEMEGHGFLGAAYANPQVAALVVRGISDLIDHKSSADSGGSQETAAQAASAFAFELLAHLEPQNLHFGEPTAATMSGRTGFKPDVRIDPLIADVTLGNWKAAAEVAVRILYTTDSSSGKNDLFLALFGYHDCPDQGRFWGALQTLESCVRLAPDLITRSQLSRMAAHENFSVRASAASICMDLAHSVPDRVPLDIALTLSVHNEDWYVEAPANAALKAMARSFPAVLVVFFNRLRSRVAGERTHAASQIESVATEEPHLLDEEQLVGEIDRLRQLDDSESAELLEKALLKVKESPKRARYRYGL